MKSQNNDPVSGQSQAISFSQLYQEISADLDTKIAKFQMRADALCSK